MFRSWKWHRGIILPNAIAIAFLSNEICIYFGLFEFIHPELRIIHSFIRQQNPFSHILPYTVFFSRKNVVCVVFFCSIYPLLYVIFNLEVDGKKTSHRKRKSGCRKKMHNSRAYSTHWILKFLRLDEGAK